MLQYEFFFLFLICRCICLPYCFYNFSILLHELKVQINQSTIVFSNSGSEILISYSQPKQRQPWTSVCESKRKKVGISVSPVEA